MQGLKQNTKAILVLANCMIPFVIGHTSILNKLIAALIPGVMSA